MLGLKCGNAYTMLVKTLDDVEYEWKIKPSNKKRKTSNLHAIARVVLKEKYPHTVFYEEVPFLVEKKQTLFLDFYCPTLNMIVEVNGKQHYEFSHFFHKTKMKFLQSVKNDNRKKEWGKLNNIRFVILPYNEIQTWEELI